MDDVEIVIKIPKGTYIHLCNGGSIGASLMIENAIKNGTPPISDSEIVKPYLEKLSKEIAEAYEEYDGYDPIALGRFEERVQDLIDNLKTDEADDICEWVKYDYRTVCPKNHDINNPYWRIPESNMDALKHCPYCGKKIKVKGEENGQ